MLVEQAPHPDRWELLRKDWDAFMRHIAEDTAPPLSDRDTRKRDDDAWRSTAAAYLRAKQDAEHSATAAEAAKEALVALASHPSESGCGVSVTQFWKRGAVDYKRVPQIKGVDLEAYRKESRIEVRVSASS